MTKQEIISYALDLIREMPRSYVVEALEDKGLSCVDAKKVVEDIEFENLWMRIADRVVKGGIWRKSKKDIDDFVWGELFKEGEHNRFADVMLQIDRVVSNMRCMQ